MSARRSLVRLQRWMQEVITHPSGVTAGIVDEHARSQIDVELEQIEGVITRSARLDSIGRLSVYSNAYFARLIECLEEEFPATRYALGEEAFETFALGYLEACPSNSYSLSFLGQRFPGYLADTRPQDVPEPGWPDFLIDLATLERTYAEVFDGPGIEKRTTLTPGELQNISEERAGNLVLEPAPCLRLLQLRFPVHEYITAVRHDQSPEFPGPEPTRLVITRRNFIVRRGRVSPEEFQLIGHLLDGRTLGDAIAEVAESTDASVEKLAENLTNWFEHWTGAGWFVSASIRDE